MSFPTRQASVWPTVLCDNKVFPLVLSFRYGGLHADCCCLSGCLEERLGQDDEVILSRDRPSEAGSRLPEEQIAVEPLTANQSGSGRRCRDAAAEGVGLEGGRRRCGRLRSFSPGRSSAQSLPAVSVAEYQQCRLLFLVLKDKLALNFQDCGGKAKTDLADRLVYQLIQQYHGCFRLITYFSFRNITSRRGLVVASSCGRGSI